MTEKILRGGEYLLAETPSADVFTPEDFSDEHRQMAETVQQFVENEIDEAFFIAKDYDPELNGIMLITE